jgi:hypothetical protein
MFFKWAPISAIGYSLQWALLMATITPGFSRSCETGVYLHREKSMVAVAAKSLLLQSCLAG